MASLQDQLLKAGIVDKDKAKKIKKEKRKAAKAQPKGQAAVDEIREQAKRTLAAKAEHDRHEHRQEGELRDGVLEEHSARRECVDSRRRWPPVAVCTHVIRT